MTTFERNHRASSFWRFVMQFGFCCLAAHSIFAATKPVISDKHGLTPDSAVAGGGEFTLTVKGTNFMVANETVSVNWNGSPRPITSIRAGQLQVTISASDIAVPGTAQVTVSNTDQSNNVATSDPATFTILPVPLIITTTTLPNGLLNVAYSQSFSASGGTPPYTWSIIAGSLPGGLNLDAPSGTLTGAPTSLGSFVFRIRVRDSAQPIASASKQFTLSVQNPVPAITGISPSSAIAGSPAFALTVNGSNFVSGSTVRWNGSARTTTLNSATSLTASIPASDVATAGTASITVNNPAPGGGTSNALSFTILPPLTITTAATLPNGVVNAGYSQSLSASGGTPPYTWLIASGSLPAGLTLDASSGTLSGTPTSSGSFTFTVRVQDSAQPIASATRQFTLAVQNPVPAILAISPNSAIAGSPAFALTVNGSNFVSGSTVRWNGSARTTTLNSATSLTASIPASDIATAGTASITVNNPAPGGGTSNALSFTILSPLTITTAATLPNGVVNTGYSQSLSASGGTPPYTWSVTSGSLPGGLNLNASSGTLTGTPTSSGSFTFTIQVQDSAQPIASASKQFTVSVQNPVPAILGISPNSAIAGSPDFALTVNGSNFVSGSTVRWNGSGRTTTLNSATSLTASIPASDIATAGTASVTVNNPAPGGGTSNALSFTISPAPVPTLNITTSSPLPNGIVDSPYSQEVSASGGTPPYHWLVSSGSLPPGVSLASGTGVLGGIPSAPGDFSFTLKVSDSTQPTASTTTKNFTLSVQNPVPVITGISPNSAIAGSPAFALTVNGSNFVSGSTVWWNGSARTTSLNSATSLTASIPASDIATAGTARITVNNPAPGGGTSNALSFAISATPVPTLNITTSSPLPNGIVDSPYSQQFSASGGTSPYHWLVSSGSLPSGVSLASITGVLDGTPSAAGDFGFTVKITDSTQPTASTTTKAFTLRINNPVPVATGLNPSSVSAGGPGFILAVAGSKFISGSIVTWNGLSRPTTFINSTSLTASISSADIVLAGSVAVAVVNPSPGGGTSSGLTFMIPSAASNPTITSSSPLPTGYLGSAYSQTLSASGGSPPYTWEVQSGSLPDGLTLNSALGVISGTPSAAGTFQFAIQVRDSASSSSNKPFQILINPLLPAVSISGPADVLTPAQQPTVQLSLAKAYPSTLSGQMTLVFTSDADEPSDDPAIQFSTGGRVVSFTIPANSTQAVFPNSAAEMAFQSGTVSGAIEISVSLQSEGTDVTPSPAPSSTFRVSRSAPFITSLAISSRSTSGFEIELIGFSTPRSLTQLEFRFTPRSGNNLGTTTFTLPLGSSSTTWFQSATSKEFGSLFRLIIPFTVQGDVNAIQSVSATLSNTLGSSNTMSTNP